MPRAFVHVVAGAGFEPTTSGSALLFREITSWPATAWFYDTRNSRWNPRLRLASQCQQAGSLARRLHRLQACPHASEPARRPASLRAGRGGKVTACFSPTVTCCSRSRKGGQHRSASGNCTCDRRAKGRPPSTPESDTCGDSRVTSTLAHPTRSRKTTSPRGAACNSGRRKPVTVTTRRFGCFSAGGAGAQGRLLPAKCSVESGAMFRRLDRLPKISSAPRSAKQRPEPASSSSLLPNWACDAARSPHFIAAISSMPRTVGRSPFRERAAAPACSRSPTHWQGTSSRRDRRGSSPVRSTGIYRRAGSPNSPPESYRPAGRSTHSATGSPPRPTAKVATTSSASSKPSGMDQSKPPSDTPPERPPRSAQ